MIRRTLLLGAGAAALASLAACGGSGSNASGADREIVFSILSTESSQNQETNWQPFLDDMRKQTGLKIKAFYAPNYFALVQAMAAKQIDLGWFSNKSGLDAVERANGEVFVRSSDPSGVDGYFSNIIVPANSTTTLDDILRCDRRLSFSMGDAESTSGTLAPMTYLFGPRGIDPDKCFKTLRSANHDANLQAVANNVIDAATNNSTALRLKPEVAAKVKVIWQSPRLPEDPIVWRRDLDPSVKEKLRSFFLSYGTAAGPEGDRQRAILAKLSFGRFMPADNNHLLPVREMSATRDLIDARNKNDAAAVKKAEEELAAIHREQERVGLATPTASAPAPAAAPAKQ
ncbi:MAG: phosphate/phosphite/phosphonate ABC transporter substrate-binding protein [Caulobacteraceae bacterium]|nr:phosphate/phosphite/phosphonate ABC transporter substrate-binding protein [Caulobacteraceae bacterium]